MLSHSAGDLSPPRFARFTREALPFVSLLLRRGADGAAAARRNGGGRPVMVIPGFLAHDRLTRRLRATLALAGYRPCGWGLGINWGVKADLLERLARRLDSLGGEKVALVGWSLGGLYARELAKLRPEAVERVITLGSPFSGDLRANRAWRLYELINRHPVDQPPIAVELGVKPPVPTFALWTDRDGIVAPGSARGQLHESDRQVQVACHHMDFVSARPALVAILDALEAELQPASYRSPPPPAAKASP